MVIECRQGDLLKSFKRCYPFQQHTTPSAMHSTQSFSQISMRGWTRKSYIAGIKEHTIPSRPNKGSHLLPRVMYMGCVTFLVYSIAIPWCQRNWRYTFNRCRPDLQSIGGFQSPQLPRPLSVGSCLTLVPQESGRKLGLHFIEALRRLVTWISTFIAAPGIRIHIAPGLSGQR
jgi:hypothetical protein